MEHAFKASFVKICQSILSQNLTELEWADMESCDMFQDAPYVGGFETIENAFCFSVYEEDGAEYWFQLKELQKFINDPNAFENQYFAEIRGV